MTTERHNPWARVKELFSLALERAPHERAEFLREKCGEDLVLKDEVESLLVAHAEAGEFAERPAIEALVLSNVAAERPALPAMTTGFELGPYRIMEPLDAGGMGEVYRALDTRLHREVAVKVLPAALTGDPDRVSRLEREARLLATLNHPHIATVHSLEVAGAMHAIVMELVDGPTLADRLSNGPLPLNLALDVARQIADALEAAHEMGIIHCDLKPANIKLTTKGSVKVLDFGLATAIAPSSRSVSIAETGTRVAARASTIAGTPAYMSPEQACGQSVDNRSDVWAFGCVLYEVLTDCPAFGRSNIAETLAAILERAPDWERLPANVPAGIRRVLRRCLEKDPRHRFHHIADVRIEIEEAINDLAGGDAAQAPQSTGGRNGMFALLTVLLALGLVVTLRVLFLRSTAGEPELRAVEITTPHTPDPWSFAVSPDGRRIAFVADHEGQPTLWVRALDTANAQALPGTEGARRPFWSPDNRSIGFFMNSQLKRIEARGGSTFTMASALGGISAAWGPDGTILFSGTDVPALRRVNVAGGTVEAATAPTSGSTVQAHPQFLPDGRQFLFFVGGPNNIRGVYLGSLDSSEVTRLFESDTQGTFVPPDLLLFVRQGTLLAQHFDVSRRTPTGDPITVADTVAFDPITGAAAFSTSNAGVMAYRPGQPSNTRLSWFDRSGIELGTLGSSEKSGLTNPTLSPDGRFVAAQRTVQNETDLWLVDSMRQTRFTYGPAGNTMRLPVWSPLGDRIAYESIGPGSVKLSVKSPAGGDEEVLFESPEVKVPSAWSPDGQSLMYYVPDSKTGTDLWLLHVATRKPFVFLKTDANELWGQFSPDGRWVAYQSNETGRYEIYVRTFPESSRQVMVSTTGGVYPRWSRDGKELFYIAPDATIMAVPVQATPTTFEAAAPTALFKTRRLGGGLNVIANGPQYDVTRDGRFLINVDAESSAVPITLLLNWKP